MSKWIKTPQNFGQQLTLAEAELKQLAEQPVSRDSQNSVVSEKSSPRANTSNQKPQAKQTQPPQKENQASHTTQPLQKANNSTQNNSSILPKAKQASRSPKQKQATPPPKKVKSRTPNTKTTVSPQKPKEQAPSPSNRQSELKQSTFSTQKPPNIVFNNLESGDSVGFESTDDDLPKFKPTYEHEVPLVDTENSNLVKTSGLL